MNVSNKVLHLSLFLAMTLPALGALAETGESEIIGNVGETQSGIQVAAGKSGGQQFKNAGEADKLRHRVNEAENDQAERKRLENQDQDSDQLKQQDRLRDQDRLKDQDQLKDQDRLRDQDQLKDGDQTKTQQQSGDQSIQQDPYKFQDKYHFEKRAA
jgi:hypothetical protein